MKEKKIKNKAARGLFKLYFGLFSAVCAFAAAFAWFEGTISKKGIELNTGKIEVAANAYSYDGATNDLTFLGDADSNEHLILNINQKEQKSLYIIVDRTVASIEVDYYLNLEVENGKGEGLTELQKQEQTRYITGFTYTFAKITSAVDDTNVPQRTFDQSCTYNNFEKRLNSYIYNCNQTSQSIYPTTPAVHSLATLSDVKEMDTLEDSLYANYYVFTYDYGSEIAQLTDRTIQLKLNLHYAQVGGLTAQQRNSDTVYCTTQAQFESAITNYLPGQTLNVTCNITMNRDLVFQAPVNLELVNSTMEINGNFIISYPYNEKSSINTKKNSKILTKSLNSNGGYFEIDVPNGEFEFIGSGRISAPDLYVQRDIQMNASYQDGITLSGAHFLTLTSTGSIPSTPTYKDVCFEDETRITVSSNSHIGTLRPYISSSSSSSVAKRVAVLLYGQIEAINLTSMGVLTGIQTVPQIFIESWGSLTDDVIRLPAWSEKWVEDSNSTNTYLGNTYIYQHFVSCDLNISTVYYYQYTNQFAKGDIVLEMRTVYVDKNNAEGTDVTIYYYSHNGITTLDGILKEYYFGNSGYTDALYQNYKNTLESYRRVQIITGLNNKITSADQDLIRSMSNVITLDLEKAKYVDNKIKASYFQNLTNLVNLSLPETITSIEARFLSGTNNVLEITIPAGVEGDRSLFYDTNPTRRVIHYKNLTKTFGDVLNLYMSNIYLGVDESVLGNYSLGGEICNVGLDGIVSEDRNYVYNEVDEGKYRIEKCLIKDFQNADLTINQFSLNSTQMGTITEIGQLAYCECKNIGNLTINNNVKKIGKNAFYSYRVYCNFNNVYINGVQNIESKAFQNVTITNNLELYNIGDIGDLCFYAFKSLNFTANNIQNCTGYNCFNNINVSNVATLTNFLNVRNQAFRSCTFGTLNVSNFYVSSSQPFYECYITNLNIGSNIATKSGLSEKEQIFTYCRVNNVSVSGSNYAKGLYFFFVLYNCENFIISNSTIVGSNVFLYGNSTIQNVEIKNTTFTDCNTILYGTTITNPIKLTNVDFGNTAYVLNNCTLDSLDISGTFSCENTTYAFRYSTINTMDLTHFSTIPYGCFRECTVLHFTNNSAVTNILSEAFYSFKKTNDTILSFVNVTTIGNNCFQYGNLEVLDLRNCTSWGSYSFWYVYKLSELHVGEPIKDMGDIYSDCLKYIFVHGSGTYSTKLSTNGIFLWDNCDVKVFMRSEYYNALPNPLNDYQYMRKMDRVVICDDLSKLLKFGTQTANENCVYNIGDGLFYFNTDLDGNGNPCVTLAALTTSKIEQDTYTTPDTITYNSNVYKVTRIDKAYSGKTIKVDTFNVSTNTYFLLSFTNQSRGNVSIETFNGNSLTTLGSHVFTSLTIGTVYMNNVTSLGDYCFSAYFYHNTAIIGTIYLNSLTTLSSNTVFWNLTVSEINLDNLLTLSGDDCFSGYHSTFGTINADKLVSITGKSFDHSGSTNYISSYYGTLNMDSLISIPAYCFDTSCSLDELNCDSLQSIYSKMRFTSHGPDVIYLPSLTILQSCTGNVFEFDKGGIKIILPELTTATGRINLSNEAKEFVAPKLVLDSDHVPQLYARSGAKIPKLDVINVSSCELQGWNWLIYNDYNYLLQKGARDLYIKTIKTQSNQNIITRLLNNKVDNIFFSGTSYSNTVGQLLDRSSFSTRVNVYVLSSVYNDIPANVLTNYGYNFIDLGPTGDPGSMYFNTIGEITVGGNTQAEYQYMEDDDGLILAKCNNPSYTGDTLTIGGNVTITKKVNGVTTTYVKPIKALGRGLFSSTTINVGTIVIDPTVTDIRYDAFGTGTSKTCTNLDLNNSGYVRTGAFSGLTVTHNLSIYRAMTLEANSMPLISGNTIRVFEKTGVIASSGAFGSSTNSSTLSVPAIKLSDYNTAAWNGIPAANISAYEDSFDVTDGTATVTYYYKLVGGNIDIVYAKSSAQLTTVHIPASATISSVSKDVTIFESEALDGLGSITGIEFPTTLKSYIFDKKYEPASLTSYSLAGTSTFFSANDGVLYDAGQTRLISYPKGKTSASYTVPSTVTSIADYAFINNSHIGSVTIAPTTSIAISNYAFKNCSNLASISITGNCSIGQSAFDGTNISSITITGNADIGDYAFAGTNVAHVAITGTTSIGAYAFKNCSQLVDITFGDKATIKSYAFASSRENISLIFQGSTVSEFVGMNTFDGLISYAIKIPSGTLSSYYENVLYDLSILSHIQEVAA